MYASAESSSSFAVFAGSAKSPPISKLTPIEGVPPGPGGSCGGHDGSSGGFCGTNMEVTNTADEVLSLYAEDSFACFGAFISGLTWTFTINGTQVPGDTTFGHNCVSSGASGTFTVTASAGGKSLTVTTTPSNQKPGEVALRLAAARAAHR